MYGLEWWGRGDILQTGDQNYIPDPLREVRLRPSYYCPLEEPMRSLSIA